VNSGDMAILALGRGLELLEGGGLLGFDLCQIWGTAPGRSAIGGLDAGRRGGIHHSKCFRMKAEVLLLSVEAAGWQWCEGQWIASAAGNSTDRGEALYTKCNAV
jgi:hypothetical protein